MTAARVLARMIAATLPPGPRARYREEWLADLDGARDAGATPAGVVLGALAVALTIDRADPRVSGLSVPALAARRARWGVAFVGVAAVLAVGLFLTGGWSGFRTEAMGSVTALAALSQLFQVAAVVAALLGMVVLVVAFATVLPLRAAPAYLVAVATGVVAGAVGLLFMSGVILLFLVLPVVAVAVLAAIMLARPAEPVVVRRRGATALAAAISAVAVLGVTALGILHVAVWNPLAKVPGMTLDEIYAGLRLAGELPSPVYLAAWAGSAVLAVAWIVLFAVIPARRFRAARSPRRILVLGLTAVTGTAFSVWVAGFGMGMGIADAFATSGGDAAATGPLLAALGIVTGIPAVLLVAVPGPREAG